MVCGLNPGRGRRFISANVQISSEAHAASSALNTAGFLFSLGKPTGARGLTSDLFIVLRLRIKVKERGNCVDYVVCFLIRCHMEPSS